MTPPGSPARRRVVLSAALLLFAASQAGAQSALTPPQGGEPPEAPAAVPSPVVYFAPLRPGTKIVYRNVDADGRESQQTWTVLPETIFNGRPVTPLRSGTTMQILDSSDRNWIATMREDGAVEEAEPHRGVFVWPLVVGKNWEAEFIYHDRSRDFSVGPIGTSWAVEAWEPVTTPAGTFEAMRLRGEPRRNNTRRTLLWYAPNPGVIVRRQVVQATGRGNERAVVTWELIDYTPG
ncbi:MAG: hypothetical protein QNJ94_00465 [Alphaproteobacteria bacterium]|nr:hypothetical protein [Alphaproteobacteria bacterium]